MKQFLFLAALAMAQVAFSQPFYFTGDTTLEIYLFGDSDPRCDALKKNPFALSTLKGPVASERADSTNNAGAAVFMLMRLPINATKTVFARAIDLNTGIIHAVACQENVQILKGHANELHLVLEPFLATSSG